MLAAEFNYKDDYIDWHMDMDDLFSHMRYRDDHPHAGALLLAFLGGGKKEDEATEEPKTSSQYSNYIEDFMADFCGSGGVSR